MHRKFIFGHGLFLVKFYNKNAETVDFIGISPTVLL